jgi:hypothetical protein
VTRDLTRRLAVLGATGTVAGAALHRLGWVAGPRRHAVRAFGQQTAMWGVTDLAIAGISAVRDPASGRPGRLRRILLVNAGLDVGYIALGAGLIALRPTLGGRVEPSAAAGHGAAIVVQGAALLVLDVVHAARLSTR